MEEAKYNIVVLGVSCLDGMASSMRVRNLLEPLIKRNIIIVNNLIYESEADRLEAKKGIINDVKYQMIGFRKANPFSVIYFFWEGIRFIKHNRSKKKKNILYNYQQADIKNIVFLLYAKLRGYKIILDIVEDNNLYSHFPNPFNRIKVRSSVFFLRFSYRIADSVIAISNYLFNKMNLICKNKIPVYLVPITVNLEAFSTQKLPKSMTEFKIFYGGSFGEKDGLEYLINAFNIVNKKFNNLTLIFTGKGSDEDVSKIKRLINDSEFSKKIFYKGYLSTAAYHDVLNDCHIFCMNRVNSAFANAGFPFKLGDFLSTGKAVIATAVGDVPNYLTNNVNALLIRPECVTDLVNALTCLINNPDKIRFLGEEARKVVLENFDSKLVSDKLLKVFKDI